MRPIDADDAIRKMESVMDMQELYLPIHFKEMVIDEVPTIEEKKGRWVNGAEIPHNRRLSYSEDITYCSNCHNEAYWDTDYGQQLFDYCPYCGARMEGIDETD